MRGSVQRERGFPASPVVETLGYSETSSTLVGAEAGGSGAWKREGSTVWVCELLLQPSLIKSALSSSQQRLHKFTGWILLSSFTHLG